MTAPGNTSQTGGGEKITAFWFSAGDRLPHGDNRLVVIGETHSVSGAIVPCKNALHASRDPFHALYYAPGPYLYKVRCWGDVVEDGDKLGARNREYLAMRDATNMLCKFAREQTLSCIPPRDAPDVVRRYLETGDDGIRAPAWEAAWIAATELAGAVARAAARKRFNELVVELFAGDPA